MATTGNIGNLTITTGLNVDKGSVASSINYVESQIRKSTQETSIAQQTAIARNAATSMAGQSGKFGNIFQEFGRGIEDVVVSASMAKNNIDAISMGLRGGANNAAQLASYFGPIAGASVAIGASLATIIVPATLRWLYNTEKIEKENKKVEDRMKGILDVAQKIGNVTAQTGQGVDVKGGAAKAFVKASETVRESRATMTELVRQAEDIQGDSRDRISKKYEQFLKDPRMKRTEIDEFKAREIEKADIAVKVINKRIATEKEAVANNEKVAARLKGQADIELREQILDGAEDLRQKKQAKDEKLAATKESLEQRMTDKLNGDLATLDSQKAAIEQEHAKTNREINEAGFDSATKQMLMDKNNARAVTEIHKAEVKARDRADATLLDNRIAANNNQIDQLQERIQKAGNANGPSAAMLRGTQAAESAISRAIAGSRSLEEVDKSQLKELQKINKNLEKQKPIPVGRL